VISATVARELARYAPVVTREAGANRYGTAAAISSANFDRGVDVVYVATGTNFPDALAAGPAASAGNGVVLLVKRSEIPAETLAELRRLDPDRIIIAGGTATISSTVEVQLSRE
jgi:putative cell wall-binding protein